MGWNAWERAGPAGRRGRRLSLGSGPEMVLGGSPLAGAGCYLPTARALARRGRVHLLEVPGCGGSDRLSVPWSLVEYADWVAGVIAESVGRPAVIGHSYGGAVAV